MVKNYEIIDSTSKDLILFLKEKQIDVEKVILFGSYARGDNHVDSDLDYIVVSPVFRDKNIFQKAEMTGRVCGNLTHKYMMPFDVLYYSDIEWEEGNSLVINAAKNYGITLYPKN